ncbi:uncharacterized protein BDR25DRAFT_332663 [Lindgomyces ingoldianus]|uniref:Uncharacterized protein n=1 Tax=Lindgomyces ingoldianus TaxID=673940 RepID=A0ACB6R505_9PLEO|nr:uncharacterized protein BDR25DRAFT_332663 [Lindgomyces ingoldianus]KAF2473918.1 hypothetical protein BDR25DRAFT_332663 [Lindgomyces ingoldianus]
MVLFKAPKNAILRFSHVERESSVTSPSQTPALDSSLVLRNSLTTTSDMPQWQSAPICKLPIEIIQQIASYLSPPCGASFCLSTRYIYYAVGTQHLSTFLSFGTSKLENRKNIEVLERAFPSNWYCAWCDKFHAHDQASGPKNCDGETKRDCNEYSSYLHAGKDYVLTYHHVRLAMNRHLWGLKYGIPISDLSYSAQRTSKLFKEKVPTNLSISAKIVSGHLLLHSAFTIALPLAATERKSFYPKLQAALPQIIFGHRNDNSGHSGLMTSVYQALCKHSKYNIQLCSTCATDYLVRVHPPSSTPTSTSSSSSPSEHIQLSIQTWRDLGTCRNPFDACWRAHGEIGDSPPGFGGDIVRLTSYKAGEIREAFELEVPFKHDSGIIFRPQLEI